MWGRDGEGGGAESLWARKDKTHNDALKVFICTAHTIRGITIVLLIFEPWQFILWIISSTLFKLFDYRNVRIAQFFLKNCVSCLKRRFFGVSRNFWLLYSAAISWSKYNRHESPLSKSTMKYVIIIRIAARVWESQGVGSHIIRLPIAYHNSSKGASIECLSLLLHSHAFYNTSSGAAATFSTGRLLLPSR